MMDAKVITICGSLKFQNKIMEEAERLELEGNCVLSPVYPTNKDKDDLSEEQIKVLGNMHKQKIKMSDAIYVVNVDGYIGNAVKEEIAYAEELGKDILYLVK